MRLIVLLFFSFQIAAFAEDSIGKVIAAEGDVKAISGASIERILERSSPIFVEDTIILANAARIQIRFTDGSLLNLIPNSEYRIDAYQYRKLLKKDHYSGELLKGGFRSLSGSIAKKNPNEYNIKTPTSTIGLRGTIIEASIVGGTVYFGVDEGRAVVSNSAGSQTIGKGAANQFCIVYSFDKEPMLISERPKNLDRSLFVEPAGGVNLDQAQVQQQSQFNKPASGSGAAAAPSAPGAPALRGASSETPAAASQEGGPSVGEAPSSGQTITPGEEEWQFKGSGGSVQINNTGC